MIYDTPSPEGSQIKVAKKQDYLKRASIWVKFFASDVNGMSQSYQSLVPG